MDAPEELHAYHAAGAVAGARGRTRGGLASWRVASPSRRARHARCLVLGAPCEHVRSRRRRFGRGAWLPSRALAAAAGRPSRRVPACRHARPSADRRDPGDSRAHARGSRPARDRADRGDSRRRRRGGEARREVLRGVLALRSRRARRAAVTRAMHARQSGRWRAHRLYSGHREQGSSSAFAPVHGAGGTPSRRRCGTALRRGPVVPPNRRLDDRAVHAGRERAFPSAVLLGRTRRDRSSATGSPCERSEERRGRWATTEARSSTRSSPPLSSCSPA